ncbi:head maturation protease, ClpP-related [Fictibacillus aquaticus]|uniref:ATP-dependent Clp protease proteolytic subunit n=1 Tax=Fictibacillus aquaticus TaxID=2021314 RepID=A0A235FAB8_9BACL|nr:head maturation protease, ClpP-related [Fictibacillus aquaticus]OYD57877.1 peptidase [Fictibacillus aquaticus]
MKNKFMEIKNQTSSSADLYFYGDIVSSEWGKWDNSDTCPEDIRSFLKDIEGVKNLNIYVNSGGGSVFAGLAIYNMLKRNQAHKTVYVDGLAGSIASVIALAGDRVIMPSNAFMMIHKPWSGMWGNSNDFRKVADDLDAIEGGILNVYAENLAEGADIEEIKQMVNEETWLNGNEAAKYFNIEVAAENQAVACVSDCFKNYRNTPEAFKEKAVEPEQPKAQAAEPAMPDQEELKNQLLLELDLI